MRYRVAQADALRSSGFHGNPDDEDVADPLGMPVDTYQAVAADLDGWGTGSPVRCSALPLGVWPPARRPSDRLTPVPGRSTLPPV